MKSLTNIRHQLEGIVACAEHAINLYDSNVKEFGSLDEDQTVSEITLSGLENCIKRIRELNEKNKNSEYC